MDGPDSGTAAGPGPGGPQGNDRGGAVRPGPGQSEIVETGPGAGLASLHEVSEKRHFLRRGWVEMGQKLLDLHIGFESADPYPLERHDRKDVDPKRAILRADKERGTITLDERTTLAGIPERHGSTGWGTAPPWSGCWTSTRRGSPGTRPSGRSSTTTAFPTTRSGSSTCCAGSAPSAWRPWR